jgi:hypothetical protein
MSFVRVHVSNACHLALFGAVLLAAGCGGGGGGGSTGGGGNQANQAPTAASATITTAADTASAAATPDVVDPDAGDTHTFAIVTPPGRGTAAVVGNQLVYTPDPAFAGHDSFTFSATDKGGKSVTGTASVTVTAVNHAPTATGGARVLFSGGASPSRRPFIDDDDAFETFAIAATSSPTSGSVTVSGDRWTYTPNAGFKGADGFTYTATDAGGLSVGGTAKLVVYDQAALDACRAPGTVNLDGTLGTIGKANPCAFYATQATRKDASGNQIGIDYFSNRLSTNGPAKALVVLIGGGNLDMGLTGFPSGLADPSGGTNFLVRSAQLIADAGYATIAIDRPLDLAQSTAADAVAAADAYRASVRHAVDILEILKHANSDNLPVFLAGTSRGAISVVAQNRIAVGVELSSPVTTDSNPAHLYVGRADVANMLPGFVTRPAHVLWEQDDACLLSQPASSLALKDALVARTSATTDFDVVAGSFHINTANASGTIVPDPCGPFANHGYLGKELDATANITAWLDVQMLALATNHVPQAAFATVPARAGVARRIDLSTLARDPDGDPLAYEVYGATTLGGTVTLDGAMATYTPPAGVANAEDALVYVVTDGKGGVAAAVVKVTIGG